MVNRDAHQMTLTRRAALCGLGAGMAGAVAPRRAAAAINGFVVTGKDDWLFGVYDEVRRADVVRMRTVVQVINEAVAALKRGGIETVICLTPSKSRIYRDYLPADFQFTPESDKRYDMSLELLRAPGTLAPDLSTVLLKLRKTQPQEQLFFKADNHWTAEGAEPVAVELANQIKAKLRLPPSPGPGTQLGPLIPARQTSFDLAGGLPDALTAKYGPESYRIHQVVQGPGGLLEDDNSDTLLVGNSFMQPKYGFAAMLSNQLGRPVSLVWKVHQSSPYRTLLDALSSDRYRKQKPKLLVWDFAEADMFERTDQQTVWGQNAMPPQAFLTQLRTIVGA